MGQLNFKFIQATIALAAIFGPCVAIAQHDTTMNIKGKIADSVMPHRANLHFQATYVYQYKPAFDAQYSGPNSLKNTMEKENSLTATLYLGVKLWKGAEVYINPELAGGNGLSGAFGLAASTNGETFRVGDPAPTLYLARGFFRQTFELGGERCDQDDQANQVACREAKDNLRLYVGKLSLGDIFDNNAYANSPRTQFMNWCLMNNGAWDYAANLRGYTYAAAAVLHMGNMGYKAALATLPVSANALELNTNLNEEYSLNAEVSRGYKLKGREGNLRLLGYYNNGHMGNYDAAINFGPGIPDVTLTRQYGRAKTGVGISADQQLSDQIGVFARAAWNDGKTETWAFTETDRSASVGMALSGNWWKRKDDVVGAAIAVNGLSASHRNYLALGGSGFQLGDAGLNYGNECAAEVFYSCKPVPYGIWLSADYQFILNPGFNQDRGPVQVVSFRLHVEL